MLEYSVLTWAPAGEVPVTCLRGGFSSSQGGGQNTPGHWDCLRVNCGYVFANTVRPLALRWNIGRPQLFSTGFCPGLVVGLFAAVLVRLIFSYCFSAYHGFVYLEDSKKVPVCLRCYVVSLAYDRSTSTSFF